MEKHSWHQFLVALRTHPGMYLTKANYECVVNSILRYACGAEDNVFDDFVKEVSKDKPYGNWIFSSLIAAEALGVDPPRLPKPLSEEQDLLCREALLDKMIEFV